MAVLERTEEDVLRSADGRGDARPLISMAVSGSVIDRIDAEISAVEAELAAARSRLSRLRSARELLAEFHEPPVPRKAGKKGAPPIREAAKPPARRLSLQERIERALSEGPTRRAELLSRVLGTGAETTAAAITTTLSRMRARGDVTNVGGNWNISLQRQAKLAADHGRRP
jgi:hypothetical protein